MQKKKIELLNIKTEALKNMYLSPDLTCPKVANIYYIDSSVQ